jgi:D,D-heptose 1,7-bisphosphate phosphatase
MEGSIFIHGSCSNGCQEHVEQMIAFILAGGKGTRLKELTSDSIPKPMVNIAGKPILQYQIEFLAKNNVNKVIISVGCGAQAIKKYFGEGKKFGLTITYSEESQPLGTAGAFKHAAPLFADAQDILVLYGDIIFDIDLQRLINFHNSFSRLGTLLVHPNDHPYDSDLLEVNRINKIIRFIPKPHPAGQLYQNLVNAGVYILKPEIARFIKSGQKLDFGQDVFPTLVANGKDLYAYRSSEYVKDAGSLERFKEVEKDILGGKVYRRNLINKQKALFLDRDGVMNKEVHYLQRPEQLELIEGSAEAVKKINNSDYLGIVVTNQSVVARGLCSEQDVAEIHKKLDVLLGEKQAFLDGIYYCPHHPERGFEGESREYKIDCSCRKPQTGMLRQAEHDFNIDPENSFMIGDATSDIMTGVNANLKTILVRTGYAGKDRKYDCLPDFVFEDLQEAVDFLIDDYGRLITEINEITAPVREMSKKYFVILVGGLSRSGKSTMAKIISIALKDKGVKSIILGLDNWLINLNNRETWMGVRDRYDYDRIENDFRSFLAGNEIHVRKYDAETRRKSESVETFKLENHEAVIIDGVVALDIPYLRRISDLKIYLDTNEELRKKRFHDFYRYKGLTIDEITPLYLERQTDEVPVIVQSKKYADQILAVKGEA